MSIELIVEAIRKAEKILVASHIHPEGDAIGSIIAMGLGLKAIGKNVCVFNKDGVPGMLRFLPGKDLVSSTLPSNIIFDLIILIDCDEFDRAGLSLERSAYEKLVIIDHHISERPKGDINLIDANASAAGLLVFKLLKGLKVPITQDIATNLYCALITDTGRFSYQNTTPETLVISSELFATGFNNEELNYHLFEENSPARLKLLGYCLETLELREGGRVASVYVDKKMFEKSGAASADTEGFINYPRSITGVDVALFFREIGPGRIKVGFRSRGVVNVGKISIDFGGGGHKNASGCEVKGSLEEVKEIIFASVRKALKERNI